MALREINVKGTDLGAFNHNNVVPGVESMLVFLAGNVHSPASTQDLKGTYTEGATPNLNEFILTTNDEPDAKVTFKGEREKSKMTYSMTQEKGLALYTINVEMYIPNMTATIHKELETFRGVALMGVVKMYDKFEVGATMETDPDADDETAATDASTLPGQYLIGWDNVLGTGISDDYQYSNFNMFLESLEFDSGAALGDKSGVTVKFTAVQGSAPIRRRIA